MPEIFRSAEKTGLGLPALAASVLGGFFLALIGTLLMYRYRGYQKSLAEPSA
jgi:hypothetical protein